jgi:hypothetical protein
MPRQWTVNWGSLRMIACCQRAQSALSRFLNGLRMSASAQGRESGLDGHRHGRALRYGEVFAV